MQPDATNALADALADRGVSEPLDVLNARDCATCGEDDCDCQVIDAEREQQLAIEIHGAMSVYEYEGVDWQDYLARAVLASDWLREHDANITRDAKVALIHQIKEDVTEAING